VTHLAQTKRWDSQKKEGRREILLISSEWHFPHQQQEVMEGKAEGWKDEWRRREVGMCPI
jgi:hypothetical protein